MRVSHVAVAALALLLVAVSAPLAHAADSPPAPVDAATAVLLDKLDAASARVRTLSGDFLQKNRLKLFKQELRSTGHLAFERPRRIRWEYLLPDPSVLVLDGDRATLRTPGAAPQVFDLAKDATMRAVFDQLLLWLGSGSVKTAQKDYAITSSGGALVLVPRSGSSVARAFSRIELRFDRELTLSGITLREANGDDKEIQLSHVQRNGTIAAGTFQ